jgi:hypothetical protein
MRKLFLKQKKPYISSPFGWGLDGGSQRIYRATRTSKMNKLRRKGDSQELMV